MDTQELDDLNEDSDEVMDYREKARAELDRIARQTKHALAEQGLDITVFFLVPNFGEGLLMFGTPADADDPTWERVSDIVSAILRQVAGLDNTRCRPVMCSATTDAEVGNEHSPMPIPTPIFRNTGAEQ